MLATEAPFPQYFELNGSPLDAGKLYFGLPYQDPETNPIPVYWDEAGTQPAAQPIRTMNGYIARSGTPALLFVDSDYSISVRSKKGELLYYAQNSAEFSNAARLASPEGSSLVGFIQAGVGAVGRTVQDKARESVSVADFGASPSATPAENTVAIQKALDAHKFVKIVSGNTYTVNGQLQLRAGQHFLVEKGAKLICNGSRIQAKDVSNVTIECNGEISSVGMLESALDPWGIVILGKTERAFIEFGGTVGVLPLPTGFKVYGEGHIYGDMVGTTAPPPSSWTTTPEIINLKGIGVWECAGEVNVSVISVSRFRGEAVYFHSPQTEVSPGVPVIPDGVIFENLHVFDVGFNGINFNAGVINNCLIRNNVVDGFSGQCVEISHGTLVGNNLSGSVGPTIQMGGGYVGEVYITDNTIVGPSTATDHTIVAVAASTNALTRSVVIKGNRILSSPALGIQSDYIGNLIVQDNWFSGYGGYAVAVGDHVPRANVSNNHFQGGTGKDILCQDSLTDAVISNNTFYDNAQKPVLVANGPYTQATKNKLIEYSFSIVSGAPISFQNVYQVINAAGGTGGHVVDGRFAKTRAEILTVNAGQTIATGKYVISTRRATSAVNGDVLDSITIDNLGHVIPETDRTQNLGSTAKAFNVAAVKAFYMAASGATWTTGFGSPNGVVVAEVGSLFTDTGGGAGTVLYVKESGSGLNTGWVAK